MGAFDVVVLGGGAAGVHVATEVAGGGQAVALVEAGLIGGESAYLACLPSNSLLLSAARGKTWEDAVAWRDEATGGLDDSGPARRLNRAGVTVIRGTGRITGPGTVEVTLAPAGGPGMGSVSLTYSDLVIATGCEPVAPPIEGLSDIPAWTTAQSLCSPDLPRRLIVLGGGPAGCELTQIYASFGSQVTLVEAEPKLLPGEPAFAGEILAAALRRAGAEIYLGSRATKAERTSDGLTLALEEGTRIDADRLLLATGRRPRLGGLGLDALGLQVTPGMALPTTTRCEVTGVRGLVGVSGLLGPAGCGPPATSPVPRTPTPAITRPAWSRRISSASAARPTTARSRAACSLRLRSLRSESSPRMRSPRTAGRIWGFGPGGSGGSGDEGVAGNGTRKMLRIAKAPADGGARPAEAVAGARGAGLITVRAHLGDTTRAHLGQDDLGCLELYADAESGVLAGAVAVGPDAASWMGEVTLAIRAKISLAVLADVVHAFPTYGEALETALRELAGTGGSTVVADQNEKGIGPLSELDMEIPEEDALEQHQEVIADETVTAAPREVPFDVDEADAAEQERAVGFDDDDYR